MAAAWPELEGEAERLLGLVFTRAYERPAQDGDEDWDRAVAIFRERVQASRCREGRITGLGTLFAAAAQHGFRAGGGDPEQPVDPGRALFVDKVKPALGNFRGEAALRAAAYALLRRCDPAEARLAAIPTARSLHARGVARARLLAALALFGVIARHLLENDDAA
jgi:hypothetical protein